MRDPAPEICPDVEEGDLVVAELRGEHGDTLGHYVEIYNASGASVDLQGLHVELRDDLQGETLGFFIRESVELPAGGYAVIGPTANVGNDAWLDYTLQWDISGGDPTPEDTGGPVYPSDLLRYAPATVSLIACGELIDTASYLALPELGSLACGNADNPPSADANDSADGEGCWCVDDQDADPGQLLPGSQAGTGTPGEVNRCP